MNLEDISSCLSISEQNGHTISTEDALLLFNSLFVLQNENHFRKILFWGRINGIEKDYYIAFGYKKDIINDRIFYYSTNCLNWVLLPEPTENAKILTPLCTCRFKGDPLYVCDVKINKDEFHFTPNIPKSRQLKEENRLAETIHRINFDVSAVPRGSVFKRPDGVITENATFQGLTQLEAKEYKNFMHLRPPTRKMNVNLITRDDYNYGVDFLDPLEIDIPEGCWTNQYADGDLIITLKSLYWPGMTIYHHLGTPKYGFIYIGDGRHTLDVPFLLNYEIYRVVFEPEDPELIKQYFD